MTEKEVTVDYIPSEQEVKQAAEVPMTEKEAEAHMKKLETITDKLQEVVDDKKAIEEMANGNFQSSLDKIEDKLSGIDDTLKQIAAHLVKPKSFLMG